MRPKKPIVEHDAALYKEWEQARRPNRPPENFQTLEERGCPFDCGLCVNHRQKSCIALLEITTQCDLGCPVCYADAGSGDFQSLETIEFMLDAAIESANGKPEVLQISGGEPTCHPQIMDILRTAMARPFKYVMLNTNGLALQNGGIPLTTSIEELFEAAASACMCKGGAIIVRRPFIGVGMVTVLVATPFLMIGSCFAISGLG